MKKLFPLALLVVAAGVVVVLTPMSARAQMAFPLYVSNNSGAFGNTIEQFGSGAAGSPFASAGLSGPEGLAFDIAGNLYAANVSGSSIEKFSPTGVDLGGFASIGNPVGLAFDTAGNLYAASFTQNKIEKFSPTGVDLGTFGSTGLSQPTGLAFDTAGNLYAANNGGGTFGSGTIVKFSQSGGSGSVFASGLNGPFGLAFDTAGDLYVANDLSNTIQKFTPLGVGTSFASTGLSTPVGLAFDSAGNLYTANQGNNTIEKFTSGGVGTSFAGTGMSSPTFLAFKHVVAGDFNADGVVNATDYVVWRKGLGTTYAQADYDVWRAHFGQNAGGGSGAIANGIVPEPATVILLLVGMIALFTCRSASVS